MSKHGGDQAEEEEDSNNECFHESLDRILSSTTCSSSSSSPCSEDDDVGDRNCSGVNGYNNALARPLPIPKFPMGVANNYDVWISRPSSVDERRMRLLRQMGLSRDSSLSRHKPSRSSWSDAVVASKYTFADQLGGHTYQVHSNSGIIRSKSADHEHCNSSSNSDHYPKILPIDTLPTETVINNVDNHLLIESRNRSGSPVVSANGSLPNKPTTGKLSNRSEEIVKCDDYSTNMNSDISSNNGEVLAEADLDSNSITSGNDAVCRIKNLDNGKEFVVDEVREDGMWGKLKEVATGRHLTMEEFETCVGHSPIVKELMRRQNVEAEINNSPDININKNRSKSKKKSNWLKSIKNAASSVAGHKEKRISDNRDTLSEKHGRRSIAATHDSVSVSVPFHGPERIRVKQYGKSCKDLTAVYKTQEIQAHNGSIWTIKFSLDGKYLASAGEDTLIHVYKVLLSSDKNNNLLFEDGNSNLLSPELSSSSPNTQKKRGSLSVTKKSTTLDHIVIPQTVFSLSEKPFCSFKGHLDDVLDLSWSTSHHLLSSSMDKTVRLWQLSSTSCLKIFSHNDYVTCIQFNPVDERYFISGSLDSKVRIWNIPEHQVVDWNDMHEMVTAACYTPDAQAAIVGSYKGSCCLYDTTENKLQQKSVINLQNKNKSRHKKITGFQFAPGTASEVLITSADSRIRVVDGIDLVHKFKGFRNTNRQISASVTSNGKYVVCASEDSQVYVWKHEGDSRPSRKKGVTVTQSYEQFNCQDVSVAIPWPGITNRHGDHLDEVATGNSNNHQLPPHPPTPEEYQADGKKESPFHGIVSSASNGYFFDRFSATWPEEKLVRRTSADFTKSKSGWGMVIVTAGIRGEIRTFQNFGLPVRI